MRQRFHPFRLLVFALILLAVAIYGTQMGVWRVFSDAWGIGNPNAIVTAPHVPQVAGDRDSDHAADGGGWTIPGLGGSQQESESEDQALGRWGEFGVSATVSINEALVLLDLMAVADPYAETDYDRSAFAGGSRWSWADLDGDGCDTRADILMRDLDISFEVDNDCYVHAGAMSIEPYTGQTERHFDARGDYEKTLDIEHAVALSDAWFSGAWQWSETERIEFANDPLNLFAADPSNNRSHGEDPIHLWPDLATKGADAANEMPNRAFLCDYSGIQTEVKAKYGLSMDPDEAAVMRGYLEDCAASEAVVAQ